MLSYFRFQLDIQMRWMRYLMLSRTVKGPLLSGCYTTMLEMRQVLQVTVCCVVVYFTVIVNVNNYYVINIVYVTVTVNNYCVINIVYVTVIVNNYYVINTIYVAVIVNLNNYYVIKHCSWEISVHGFHEYYIHVYMKHEFTSPQILIYNKKKNIFYSSKIHPDQFCIYIVYNVIHLSYYWFCKGSNEVTRIFGKKRNYFNLCIINWKTSSVT